MENGCGADGDALIGYMRVGVVRFHMLFLVTKAGSNPVSHFLYNTSY